MSKSIGIVGSGLLGRLLAHRLLLDGHTVHIFDRDDEVGSLSCGWTGAGMLAPYSELDLADEPIFSLGRESLALWPGIVNSLAKPVFLQIAGTLAVAHAQDRAELSRFQRNIEHKLEILRASAHNRGFPIGGRMQCAPTRGRRDAGAPRGIGDIGRAWRAPTRSGQDACAGSEQSLVLQNIESDVIADLEPELSTRFHSALYLPDEGQIDNRQLLDALTDTLKASGVKWTCHSNINHIEPNIIQAAPSSKLQFDLVIDTRGLGAKADLPKLRGVRGEIIRVLAPQVNISRLIRVMHPRYPLYIVPRQEHHYLIGATSIESDDARPITVQSALELLSAAFSIHSGFAEGSILEMSARSRPALIDNAPKIYVEPGLMRINGLYRHGFLISPKLVELAIALIRNNLRVDSQLEIEAEYRAIIIENINLADQYLPHSRLVAKNANIVN